MKWPAFYEIQVAEPLDRHWLQWFLDMEIAPSQDQDCPGTVLRGKMRDQAALFGSLARIRDLNLTLLIVRRIEEA